MRSSPQSDSMLTVWSLLGILSLQLSAPPSLVLFLSLKINLKNGGGGGKGKMPSKCYTKHNIEKTAISTVPSCKLSSVSAVETIKAVI